MNKKNQERTEIADYFDVLGVEAGLAPVVVGGQAVNAWAMYYSGRLGSKLARYRPFTSKDLDVAGNRDLLERIQRITNGAIFYSEPRSPVIGYVEVPVGDRTRRIEVLRNVKGLGDEEIDDCLRLRIGDTVVRVLAPTKVLKAKICNVCTLEQARRNDVNHLQVMILCIKEFVLDLLGRVTEGQGSQRDLVDLLEEIRAITTTPMARDAEAKWNLDFSQVWPRRELGDSGLQKVVRFLQHRLP